MRASIGNHVITQKQGLAGVITLNRPEQLHSLTTSMCDQISQVLSLWERDPDVSIVLIESSPGTRAFCAGGDVRMLAESGRGDGREAREFFKAEYRLNAQIKSYSKPYIALIDGITMGGGAGISIHGSHRISTERTVFAMPETGIGLFPDVGATWFLPRLDGELGLWLALTGARLKGADVLAAGLATHYIESKDIAALKQKLINVGLEALEGCSRTAEFSLSKQLPEINRCFALKSVRGILTQLNKGSPWARDEARKIAAKSPLSLHIAYKQLRIGKYIDDFQSAMMVEYRIATRLVSSHDFREGVRAVLVDKDHTPCWRPAHLFRVSNDFVSAYFSPLGDEELTFDGEVLI